MNKKDIEDFINSFKADKALRYGLACSITACAATVGIDISNNQQQDIQDKHIEGLVDQVLDNMLHKLETYKS